MFYVKSNTVSPWIHMCCVLENTFTHALYMCFVQKKYIYMCCVQEKYLYSCIHVSCINEKYIYSCIRMHYVQEKLILLMHSHVLCPGKIHFTGTHAFTVGVSVILYLVLTWLCTVQCTNVHCTLCRIYCSTVCKSGI